MEGSVSGKYRVWLMYDLSYRSSTQGLYEFLDKYEAKECGESAATFMYPFRSQDTSGLPDALKAELEQLIKLNDDARIYLVYPKAVSYPDQASKKPFYQTAGTLLSGKRKPALWAGYFKVGKEGDIDE